MTLILCLFNIALFLSSVAAKLSHEIRLLTSERSRHRKSADGGPTQGCYQKSAGKQSYDIKREIGFHRVARNGTRDCNLISPFPYFESNEIPLFLLFYVELSKRNLHV